MDFDFDEFGRASIGTHLECHFKLPVDAFFTKYSDQTQKLSLKSKELISRVAATDAPEAVPEVLRAEITMCFMEIGAQIMRKKMDAMPICGAAKFIPPH